MTERSSPNLMAVSLLAGLAGAAAALLLAPRSGAETRKKIHDQADELKDRTQEGLHEVKDTVSSGLNKFSAALSSGKQKVKEEFEEFSEPGNRSKNKQSSVLHAWEEEV